MSSLGPIEISFRLVLAMMFSGIIGWEREYNARPAGLRTNIMVCIGAAIIAMIQVEIMDQVLRIAKDNPGMETVLRSDPARLICQVVSGVGFLGAGTIVITKNSVRGLTTAATLWSLAGLGLAIGMGYYMIAVLGFVIILVVLILLKRVIRVQPRKHIKIKFHHRKDTQTYIESYFKDHNIRVNDSDFSLDVNTDGRVYTILYTVEFPHTVTYVDLAEDLTSNKDIQHISLVNI